MLRSILFILALILNNSLHGQNIFTTNEFKKGVYKNFTEFLNNKPSIPLNEENIEIEKDELYLIDNVSGLIIYQGNELILPIFRLKDKRKGKRIKTKQYWGFCDGKNIYINSYTHTSRHYFVKVLVIGRFCYFLQIGFQANYSNIEKPFRKYNFCDEYILNVNNGQMAILNKKLLKKILENDLELLEEFNNDKEAKRKLFIDYIIKYNKLHQKEIKL